MQRNSHFIATASAKRVHALLLRLEIVRLPAVVLKEIDKGFVNQEATDPDYTISKEVEDFAEY